MKWILLLSDNPKYRQLYVRLLERRGHLVHFTRELDDAHRLVDSGDLDLAIIDEELDDPSLGPRLDQWADYPDAPPLLLLSAPEPDPTEQTTLVLGETSAHIDLVLKKPLSPVEFGIQIDYFLEPEPGSSLEESSEVEREFDSMQQEFVFQLDEDVQRLQTLCDAHFEADVSDPKSAARLYRAISSMRVGSRHFQFGELAAELATLEGFVESFLPDEKEPTPGDAGRAQQLLSAIEQTCQKIQADPPAAAGSVQQFEYAQTILVVDPDPDYLEAIEDFGDQFMLRIRTTQTLTEAIQRVQTPLLVGVLLSISATPSPTDLHRATNRLRQASPLESLPIALVGQNGEDLDRVQSLWAGASMLISKPITASIFAQTARRLTSLRRAQKSSIFILEPDGEFAEFVANQLGGPHTAIHYQDEATTLFESLEKHRPDLLIVDTHIPHISSFDLCRALRAIPRWQDLPILMIDDEDRDQSRLAAYQAGADDFFCRDIDAEEFRARIDVRLQRARLIRERVDQDSLTGLLTRRAFLEQLAGRLSETARHDRNLAFCLLDIDRFKKVNDTYGHPTGDQVLETLGQLLRDRFRVEDLRARWGGEEFAVVLVDEDAATAQMALERVLKEFSEKTFTGPRDASFHVTFSAGIAECPGDGQDAESLLAAADNRLLRAKRAGRNQILIGQN